MKRAVLLLLVVLSLMVTAVPVFAEGTLTLSERSVFLFVNSGQMGIWERVSYDNPNGETLKLIIPKGATQIQGGTAKGAINLKPEDMKETADGLELSIDIPKGSDLVELSYAVKPEGNLYDFSTKINYPTKAFVFMSSGNIAVTGPKVAQGEPKKSGDMNIVLFPVKGELNVGDTVEARMDIAPTDLNPAAQQQQGTDQQQAEQQQAAANQQQAGALDKPYNPEFHNPGHIRLWNTSVFKKLDPHLFTALLVIIPIGLIAFYVIQRRKEKMLETVDVEELAFQKLTAKQKDLLQKLADLDEKYESGQMDEEEYTTLRENYKHRLLQIKAHLQKFSE